MDHSDDHAPIEENARFRHLVEIDGNADSRVGPFSKTIAGEAILKLVDRWRLRFDGRPVPHEHNIPLESPRPAR